MTATILSPADAHWMLTGHGLTPAQADQAIAHMNGYSTPLTEANLRDWAYTAR